MDERHGEHRRSRSGGVRSLCEGTDGGDRACGPGRTAPGLLHRADDASDAQERRAAGGSNGAGAGFRQASVIVAFRGPSALVSRARIAWLDVIGMPMTLAHDPRIVDCLGQNWGRRRMSPVRSRHGPLGWRAVSLHKQCRKFPRHRPGRRAGKRFAPHAAGRLCQTGGQAQGRLNKERGL